MKFINSKSFFLLLIFIFSLIPLYDFMRDGFPITHDGKDHIARIANFYSNINEGTLIPRWAGKLNWGYGHPILMFLYPFPSYMASMFIFMGIGLINSVKLVFVISYIFSGLSMFLWLRKHFSNITGFVGSMLYLFAPYRFVDMYVRGAIGEHTAFMFLPLIMLFLFNVYKQKQYRYLVLASVSIAGLILSHNAISLMFLPVVFIYMFYLFYKSGFDNKIIIKFMVVLILAFALSAFFWIPAFFEGKYTLRSIVTTKDYSNRFVPLYDFISTDWNYGGTDVLSKHIGLVQITLTFVSLFVILRDGVISKNNFLLKFSLTVFLLSIFIMTYYSKPIWDILSILQKFQFPWRFLTLSVFSTAVIGSAVFRKIARKYAILPAAIIVILLLFTNYKYWHANGYLNFPESLYSSVYNSTTDTGESSPVWSVRFMESQATSNIEVIEGSATINELFRSNTHHIYQIETKEKVRVKENTLYFPGWRIRINNKEIKPEFQDPNHRGLMTFFVEKGVSVIDIKFQETRLRKIANIISLSGLILTILYAIIIKYKHGKAFRGTRYI